VSFGILLPNQSADAKIILRNPSPQAVTVDRIETSCHCLRVEKQPIKLLAEESVTLVLRFDSSDDPGFRGGLSIGVAGRDSTGGIVFETHADVEVRAEPAKATGLESADLVAPQQGGSP
jgi:Protein of unknown function (DUF1573)